MVKEAFFLILAAFTAFLPVLFWGYAFSYLDADRLNAKRFFLGIAAGSAAVFPVAFMPEVFSFLPGDGNVFKSIADRASAFSLSLEFASFLIVVCLVVAAVSFLLRSDFFKDSKTFALSFLAVVASIPTIFLLSLGLRAAFSGTESPEVHIAGAAIAGFTAIALSYFVVAAVEEGGKHLGLYGTSSVAEFAKKGAVYAAFVALGFAFAENVLYLSSLLSKDAPFSSFFSTWFSRSIFSVAVHTLCSLAAALPFLAVIRRGEGGIALAKAAFVGLSTAYALHLVFDVSVSYGKTAIVFLYLALAYGYLTRAFHKPSEAISDR